MKVQQETAVRRLGWIALALLLALTAHAKKRVPEASTTRATKPHPPTVTLRIGVIPFNASKVGVTTDTDRSLQVYFDRVSALYLARGIDLHLIPVKGNYYQVLKWARDGAIDGAVVSSFTAHLLTNDRNVAVFPVAEFHRPEPVGLPTSTLSVRVRASGPGVRTKGTALKLLGNCLDAALNSVAEPATPQECELRFVSHLSATGFIVPLLYINEFASANSDKLATIRDQSAFWKRLMSWSRFELWHGIAVGDHPNVPTIRFSYRGEGEVLPMKTAIPSLGDALLLTHRRFLPRSIDKDDAHRAASLLGETERAGGDLVRGLLPSSAAAENGPPNTNSPWIQAGSAMTELAAREVEAAFARSEKKEWSGYDGTAAWNQSQRERFTSVLDGVFRVPGKLNPKTQEIEEPPLTGFYDRWYRDGDYAFTVDELIDVLQADQVIREAPRATLVLPGGGVRATYQSVILDYLYGHRIANSGTFISEETEPAAANAAPPPGDSAEGRLLIKGIAGTSGGALLGYLASLRDTRVSHELTEQWIDSRDELVTQPLDIFPAFGVLRWFSLLLVLVVFAATAAVHLPSRLKAASVSQVPFWYTSLVTVVIAATPFLLWRHLIHNPVYPGSYETYAVLIIVVAAHFIHSVSRPHSRSLSGRPRFWFSLGAVVVSIGLLLTWFLIRQTPALGSRSVASPLLLDSRIWSVLTSTAILLMIFGLSIIAASQGTRLNRGLINEYLESWLVVLLLVFVGGAVFLVGYSLEHVTSLEMTIDYWFWVFIGALFASKLVVTMGRVYHGAPLSRGIEFLSRSTGSAPIPYTPAMSFVIWGCVVLTVWLAFVAPGLYSSDNGRSEFHRAIAAHPHARVRVPLIVSMTGFGGNSAGFTKYEPGDYYASQRGWAGVDPPDGTTSARLFLLESEPFQRAVFASGSPFPIYPAADVQAEDDKRPGLFLDGGYAHRVPLEAAGLVRAAQILVVENTSLNVDDSSDKQRLGTLTTNLAKGLSFLFERSQGTDTQRSRHALVGTIYPDWSGPSPFLMDFRGEVVRRLIREANRNLHGQRVARIQSWGEPIPKQQKRTS